MHPEPQRALGRRRGRLQEAQARRRVAQVARQAGDEIVFVPFAGWDAAGARWFGYPTFWVNRQGLPPEELGVRADAMGASLAELVELVTAGREWPGAPGRDEVERAVLGRDERAVESP
ncbi:hypothetical protein [Sorangium sp. So ce1182]|uniref:hypothetical protein n=1 Tax=Sorangium sp. So ce1182 TaxID=3133334 RepID=UPI003F62506F